MIANDAILAGSLTSDGKLGSYDDAPEGDLSGARAPRFNLWEEIDETNGYVDKQY